MLKSRAKRIAPGAAAMALFLMAFLGVRQESQRADPRPAGSPTPAPAAVEVGIGRLARVQKFSADIKPWIAEGIRPGVAGRVLEKLIDHGAAVKKDDVLLRLDETRARIAMDNALARHTEASRSLDETQRLRKSGTVAETAVEAALAEVRESRIRLDEAREVLAAHTVRAPISGVVSALTVRAGDMLEKNQPVGTVADIEKLRIFLHVPQADPALFQPGKKLPLRLSRKSRDTLWPEVLFVSPSADPKTGLFKIEAILNNKNRAVSADIQGTIEIEGEVLPEGPVLPLEAVRFSKNGTTVLRMENGKAVLAPVHVGPVIDGMVPVLDGLRAGDRVLVGQPP